MKWISKVEWRKDANKGGNKTPRKRKEFKVALKEKDEWISKVYEKKQ